MGNSVLKGWNIEKVHDFSLLYEATLFEARYVFFFKGKVLFSHNNVENLLKSYVCLWSQKVPDPI